MMQLPNGNNTITNGLGWDANVVGTYDTSAAMFTASPMEVAGVQNGHEEVDTAGSSILAEKLKWDASGGVPMFSTPNCV